MVYEREMIVRPAPMVAVAHNTSLNHSTIRAGDVNEIASYFTDHFGNPADVADVVNVQGWVVQLSHNEKTAVATKSISQGVYR